MNEFISFLGTQALFCLAVGVLAVALWPSTFGAFTRKDD